MDLRATLRANAILRKFEQLARHSEELREALAQNDQELAWEHATKLRACMSAAKHLVEADRHASRLERESR